MTRPSLLALACLVFTAAVSTGQSSGGQWFGSKALRLTTGNGINSAVSLWRLPDEERAELRIMVVRQSDAVDATGAWLWVGKESHLLTCSRIEASFFKTEGFRSCFSSFPGFQSATTISRCALDWGTSQRIVDGAPVELQIDTELKLLKRKRLSTRKLAELTSLRPIPR